MNPLSQLITLSILCAVAACKEPETPNQILRRQVNRCMQQAQQIGPDALNEIREVDRYLTQQKVDRFTSRNISGAYAIMNWQCSSLETLEDEWEAGLARIRQEIPVKFKGDARGRQLAEIMIELTQAHLTNVRLTRQELLVNIRQLKKERGL